MGRKMAGFFTPTSREIIVYIYTKSRQSWKVRSNPKSAEISGAYLESGRIIECTTPYGEGFVLKQDQDEIRDESEEVQEDHPFGGNTEEAQGEKQPEDIPGP